MMNDVEMKNKSLFCRLLTVIMDRQDSANLVQYGTRFPVEYMEYIQGLNTALDIDINDGAIDPKASSDNVPSNILEIVFSKITPPLAQPYPDCPPVKWSKPCEVWQEPEVSDPRERLLARLVHLGFDPWLSNPKYSNGRSVAHLYLVSGYPSLLDQAISLNPRFSLNEIETPLGNGLSAQSKFTLMQVAVKNNYLDHVKNFINMGASVDDVLQYSSSTEMVRLLMDSGFSIKEDTGTQVAKIWTTNNSADAAREMLAVFQEYTSPQQSFKDAVSGGLWRPISDVLKKYPNWETLKDDATIEGVRDIPLHLGNLFRCNTDKPTTIKYAVKLFLMAEPFSESDWCIPGIITKNTLARLRLQSLKRKPIIVNNKAAGEELSNAYASLIPHGETSESILEKDIFSLSRCGEMLNGLPFVSSLAMLAIEHEMAKKTPIRRFVSGPEGRLLEQHILIGKLSRVARYGKALLSADSDSWFKLFGIGSKSPSQSKLDSARFGLMVTRLLAENRSESIQSEIYSSALWQFSLVAKSDYFSKDYVSDQAKMLRSLLDNGVYPGWTMKEADDFKKSFGNSKLGGMESVISVLCHPLEALAEERFLMLNTKAAELDTSRKKGLRL